MCDQRRLKDSATDHLVRAGLRTAQFLAAVIVAGLYGADLQHATTVPSHAGLAWIYAEVVVVLSATTCIAQCFTATRGGCFAWDCVLAVLWTALAGVFGAMYIGGAVDDGASTSPMRMKIAVGIDVVNMLLWFIAAGLDCAACVLARGVTRRVDLLERQEGGGERFVVAMKSCDSDSSALSYDE